MNEKFIELLKQEVKPALGCTEPIAVALAVARSKEELGGKYDRAEIEVSGNILKNGMGVGIPGTGMVGLDIAASLSLICGKSEYGLEVLKDVCDEDVTLAKKLVEEGKISISLAENSPRLYIKATLILGGNKVSTIIKGGHDNIVCVEKDGIALFSKEVEKELDESSFAREITVRQIFDFATSVPLSDIEFILDSEKVNRTLAEEGLQNKYGLNVGSTLISKNHNDVFGDNLHTYAMAMTAAASDARMGGSTLPAMSNSGSGNQGITVTMPVIAVADKIGSSKEELARALVMSHLVAIHIKGYLGRLSALCGCVVASTGASAGIVYLKSGSYDQICYSIKNMIGNISGMLCDGAKVGCALKVSTGVSAAIQSSVLALDDICISSNDGIIEDDVEKTIENVGNIGSKGMDLIDKMVLEIMTNK